ncbi:MAG: extracellular solute-binding protein [Chloroflexota bacterium]
MGTDTRALWYNKAIFKKVGLPVPWHPKTWNDLLAATRQIKAKEPGVIPYNIYSGTPAGEAVHSLPEAHRGDWRCRGPAQQPIARLLATALAPACPLPVWVPRGGTGSAVRFAGCSPWRRLWDSCCSFSWARSSGRSI